RPVPGCPPGPVPPGDIAGGLFVGDGRCPRRPYAGRGVRLGPPRGGEDAFGQSPHLRDRAGQVVGVVVAVQPDGDVLVINASVPPDRRGLEVAVRQDLAAVPPLVELLSARSWFAP